MSRNIYNPTIYSGLTFSGFLRYNFRHGKGKKENFKLFKKFL